ncbi:hypothetical protein [Deinococcus gobiensis]|uniref:Uncharacterized protein n=1 Tax=Deinococcus gobiensis (strain DSM 21396 / JCM 16679 / CGMCC 1.7299 / I-0) TaxID=745776 RepID=H8GXR0_DEIGI|nr:hypothetical protein [Deinococcus gobiensis]AFD25912.1 hypothetical protein DGo_CA1985 [Deinococcus gobiensis I-0]
MTGGQARPLPLYGVCDSCGAPNGIPYHYPTGAIEYLCTRCAQRRAIYDAAYDQLELQVRGVVSAWLSVWGTLPGVVDLHEHLLQIGAKVEADYKAGTFPPEGVQPFLPAA